MLVCTSGKIYVKLDIEVASGKRRLSLVVVGRKESCPSALHLRVT